MVYTGDVDNDARPAGRGESNSSWKWALGAAAAVILLDPEARASIWRILSQFDDAVAAYQRQKELEERVGRATALPPLSLGVGISGAGLLAAPALRGLLPANRLGEPLLSGASVPPAPGSSAADLALISDSAWLGKVVHPSVVLLLGKRGSGKSAVGYRLLELYRHALTPYVVGLPEAARKLLPDWIGMAPDPELVPPKSIVLVDEAYLRYHSRGSMAGESRAMSQLLNLSRQREQTLLFVTPEARQLDRNVASAASVLIFKEPGMLQLEFERPELNRIVAKAKQTFETTRGDKRKWSYVYSPDANFEGLLESSLPTFWSNKLSHAFAAGGPSPGVHMPKKMTLKERIEKARELRRAGQSLSQIARTLGVSKPTAHNYVRGYPHRLGARQQPPS